VLAELLKFDFLLQEKVTPMQWLFDFLIILFSASS